MSHFDVTIALYMLTTNSFLKCKQQYIRTSDFVVHVQSQSQIFPQHFYMYEHVVLEEIRPLEDFHKHFAPMVYHSHNPYARTHARLRSRLTLTFLSLCTTQTPPSFLPSSLTNEQITTNSHAKIQHNFFLVGAFCVVDAANSL